MQNDLQVITNVGNDFDNQENNIFLDKWLSDTFQIGNIVTLITKNVQIKISEKMLV